MSLQKFFRIFASCSSLWLVLMTALFSCQEDKQLGAELLPNIGIDTTLFADTFSIETHVIHLDSVNTSYGGNLLVGNVHQAGIGRSTASAYFELFHRALYEPAYPDKIQSYDSASLVFRFSSVYGNANKVLKLAVWELDDTLRFPHYNSDKIPRKRLLGTFNFSALRKTTNSDTFEIKLPNDYGRKFFDARTDTTIKTQTQFNLKLSKGIEISCENTDEAAIISLPISLMNVRFYFTVADTTGLKKRIRILYPSSRRFTHISLEKEGELAKVPLGKKVKTTQLGNQCFVHAGVGITTEIRFPHLDKLETDKYHILVNRAELILNPVLGSIDPAKLPPYNLYFVLSDQNAKPAQRNKDTLVYLRSEPILQTPSNILQPPLPYTVRTSLLGVSSVQTFVGRLIYNENARNYYTLDNTYMSNSWITTYVQNIVDKKEKRGLLLIPDYPGFRMTQIDNSTITYTNVHALIFGNERYPTFPLKLRVYYTKIPK